MKEKAIIRDILSGMYIVSTIDSACVVDTVLQVSSTSKPLISVAINKNNYTNEMLKKYKKFVVAILSKNVSGKVIETFGFHSSRDIDKFKDFDYFEISKIKVLKDVIGYLVLEVETIVDAVSHDIFIGSLEESKRFNNEEPLLYQYYQDHKDNYIKVKTKEGKTAYLCTVCGYIYYGDELPVDFKCPMCGVGREAFVKKD